MVTCDTAAADSKRGTISKHLSMPRAAAAPFHFVNAIDVLEVLAKDHNELHFVIFHFVNAIEEMAPQDDYT